LSQEINYFLLAGTPSTWADNFTRKPSIKQQSLPHHTYGLGCCIHASIPKLFAGSPKAYRQILYYFKQSD
jgi:hypothetical protein